MNVLSLFDGMSCGQIALRELGIQVDNYFASEIDKYAIAQTQLNFPNTIQLGSVTEVHAADLPKIDLLIGGSPCQGFSFAGKGLNFNDPRSALFFEYVRVLKEVRAINPDVKFLLENVRMKKEHEAVISDQLGLQPVMINSSLVSAQNRVRLYWTNIRTRTEGLFGDLYTDISQPKDKGLLLRDILEENVPKKYTISNKLYSWLKRHSDKRGAEIRMLGGNDKAHCFVSSSLKLNLGTDYIRVATNDAACLTPTIYTRPRGKNNGKYSYEKSPTLTSNSWESNNTLCDNTSHCIRRLTPTECARLQTIPAWYKWKCSETQQYKMLGNGWTVEVIIHIFSFIK